MGRQGSIADSISDEELIRAMAQAVDDEGNDVALEKATAAMSQESRRRSEENVRRWVEKARRAIRNDD